MSSGFLRGFTQGWGLVDDQIQQQKADERYEAEQARNESRYQDALTRQNEMDARSKELHNIQLEQAEYNKSQRPIQEQQTQLGIQQSKQNLAINDFKLKEAERKHEEQEINRWGERLTLEFDNGEINPDTYNNFQKYAKGTAFNLDDIGDPEYISALDFLSGVTQNPESARDPRALAAFNRVFRDNINSGKMVSGGVRKEITSVIPSKNGKISFEVTTFNAEGKPIRKAPLTTGRSPEDGEGTGVLLEAGDLIGNIQARKMVAARFLSDPRTKEGIDRLRGQLRTSTNDVTKLAPRAKSLQEQYKAIIAQRNRVINKASSQNDLGVALTDDARNSIIQTADADMAAQMQKLAGTFSKEEFEAAGIPLPEVKPSGGGQPQVTDQQKIEAAKLILSQTGVM